MRRQYGQGPQPALHVGVGEQMQQTFDAAEFVDAGLRQFFEQTLLALHFELIADLTYPGERTIAMQMTQRLQQILQAVTQRFALCAVCSVDTRRTAGPARYRPK